MMDPSKERKGRTMERRILISFQVRLVVHVAFLFGEGITMRGESLRTLFDFLVA